MAWVLCGLALGLTPARALGATWTVDRSNPACFDGGPGSATTPFCTIQAGAEAAAAGDTVRVRPAVYREQVDPPRSGTLLAPIVFEAAGPDTTILGTIDISDRFSWTNVGDGIWRRSISFSTRQVFVDGERLDAAPGSDQMTDHSFFFDADRGRLYVDLGGPNPGIGHTVEASAFTYGLNLVGLNNVVVDGFTLAQQNSVGARTLNCSSVTLRGLNVSSSGTYGIRVEGAAGPVLVDSCEVFAAASNGILALNASSVTLRGNRSHDNGFHGISLQGTSNSLVTANTCFRNVYRSERSATGIDISSHSEDNLILANTTYENQDSGIEVYSSSDDNLVARNVSWSNGDHGFDSKGANRTRFVSNTSYRNFKDGFSVEDGRDITLRNNIAVDNGLGTDEFNLYVDDLAVEGFSSDYDIFWNSVPVTSIQMDNINYNSLEEFRIDTGNEMHGLEADPLFLDRSAFDLRLSQGSPGIDAADAGAVGFQAADHDGLMPADDPAVDDTGAGDPTYADRGAFENEPAPQAFLVVTPPLGTIDLSVEADASRSHTYSGTPITSYVFDFGDGTLWEPQSSPFATHTYTRPGIYLVRVYATDRLTSSASASVVVLDRPPTLSLSIGPAGKDSRIITVDAAASSDHDATPIASYLFDFGDGVTVGPQETPAATHAYRRNGLYRVSVTITDNAGLSAQASMLVDTKLRMSVRISEATAAPSLGVRSRRPRKR